MSAQERRLRVRWVGSRTAAGRVLTPVPGGGIWGDRAPMPPMTPIRQEEGPGPVMPLLLGYQSARSSTTPRTLRAGRQSLVRFAQAEGFALGEIFVESDTCRPASALSALIEAADRHGARAVAVPSVEDLGRLPRVQELTRRRLCEAVGVQVYVVQASL